MISLNDREIMKASETIDKALLTIDNNNRGEVAVRILSIARNLNDHIADKIWKEINPSQPMGLQKVASKFSIVRNYKFIAQFDKYLRKSVSHFTPSEDGGERLMIKYYHYFLLLKKAFFDRYGIDILKNIDLFLEDIDEQTKNYYSKVSEQIEYTLSYIYTNKNFDNYYISRIKPFFINREIYYEVTLEPASERPNKFNRITAFTKCNITTRYCVALSFIDTYINIFDVNFPIKIITDWNVSIRPCEINNFAKIVNIDLNIQRSHGEYRALMDCLKNDIDSLVDLIDLNDIEYNKFKNEVSNGAKSKHSRIFDVLDQCRYFSVNNYLGSNSIRYLLVKMNNRIIKDHWPTAPEKAFRNLFLTTKSIPFNYLPYSFNPPGHYSNYYDLIECIDSRGKEGQLLARFIENNTSQNGVLFTPFEELSLFGDFTKINNLIIEYNKHIYEGFKPDAELGVFNNYVYIKGYETDTVKIITELNRLCVENNPYKSDFSDTNICNLKQLSFPNRLDDISKENILKSMANDSRIHFIYGAAGTGKTTVINHISNLMSGRKRVFMAKTNPAVENLYRKVINKDENDDFVTIDRFTKNSWYSNIDYDLVVVDECSTVKNEEILKILNMAGHALVVLIGDTYQIEAIGFGNWFNISKKSISSCSHELTIPYRSTNKELMTLWKEVRNMSSNDNVVLEETVRNDYSHPIDNDIFIKKADDEIILCLNYNGLYGLNNINRLLQLSNPNPAVTLGIWQFKIGDPILFNDSERFSALYNNLKGKILDIVDTKDYVKFTVEADIVLEDDDIVYSPGLTIDETKEYTTVVSFNVNKRAPYSSDADEISRDHIIPFQVAYAVSIHKSQGLEYDSVKIVIADETEDRITHNIFYTAITRARNDLTIYWSPEVCNRILSRIQPVDYNKDYYLLKAKNNLQFDFLN